MESVDSDLSRGNPLLIAATRKHFRKDLMFDNERRGFVPAPKDPVVFYPMEFKGTYRECYLIVTAWGPEAEDREIRMPK